MPVPRPILEKIKQLIPPLNGTLHKGQSGRVGVLGGALDYTGAPFFASISALRFGADLSHVICSPTAAPAIKSYSPDLIVHPILREDDPTNSIRDALSSLLSRLHVLVVGPGLGREKYMQKYALMALSMARDRGMYLVLDADALILVGDDPNIVRGYRKAVLTPNVVEFKRLSQSLHLGSGKNKADALEVSRALGGVTVLEKGPKDVIAVDTTISDVADLEKFKIDRKDQEEEKAKERVEVDVEGGMKRCGGQGDVLSGCVATMLAWGKCYEDGVFGDKSLPISRIPLLAAVGGSMVTRATSRRAYFNEGRSVVTEDMLPEIGKAFSETFGEDKQGQDKGKL